MSKKPSEDYRQVAKKLRVKYLFGRWGLQWLPRDPAGHMRWKFIIVPHLFQVIPLDGWITDPKEVMREMRERGLEL